MDSDWTLLEYRPGRYIKLTPEGEVLGKATEAEVLAWFADRRREAGPDRHSATLAAPDGLPTATPGVEIWGRPRAEPQPATPPAEARSAGQPAGVEIWGRPRAEVHPSASPSVAQAARDTSAVEQRGRALAEPQPTVPSISAQSSPRPVDVVPEGEPQVVPNGAVSSTGAELPAEEGTSGLREPPPEFVIPEPTPAPVGGVKGLHTVAPEDAKTMVVGSLPVAPEARPAARSAQEDASVVLADGVPALAAAGGDAPQVTGDSPAQTAPAAQGYREPTHGFDDARATPRSPELPSREPSGWEAHRRGLEPVAEPAGTVESMDADDILPEPTALQPEEWLPELEIEAVAWPDVLGDGEDRLPPDGQWTQHPSHEQEFEWAERIRPAEPETVPSARTRGDAGELSPESAGDAGAAPVLEFKEGQPKPRVAEVDELQHTLEQEAAEAHTWEPAVSLPRTADNGNGADRWLWLDPRSESGFDAASFDLTKFLQEGMARFRTKPWVQGRSPGRLMVHPNLLTDGLEQVAAALRLTVVTDPRVALGTYRLGLPEDG